MPLIYILLHSPAVSALPSFLSNLTSISACLCVQGFVCFMCVRVCVCAGVCVRGRVCACRAVCISCACRRGICRSIYLYICLSKCPLWRAFALCALSRFISVFSTLFFAPAPLRFRFCFSYFSFCSSSHSSLSAARLGRGQQMTYPHKPRHTHTLLHALPLLLATVWLLRLALRA